MADDRCALTCEALPFQEIVECTILLGDVVYCSADRMLIFEPIVEYVLVAWTVKPDADHHVICADEMETIHDFDFIELLKLSNRLLPNIIAFSTPKQYDIKIRIVTSIWGLC